MARAERTTPSIRRQPESLFERPWPWIVLFALLGILVVALSFLGIRALQGPEESSSSTWLLIVALGVITLLLILTTFFYSARKRLLQERLGGTMLAWLKSHVWLGVVALIAALAHAFLFPLDLRLSSGWVTTLILAILVLSGMAWRLVYQTTPRKVPDAVGNLSIIDTRDRLERLRIEIDKVKVGKSEAFQAAVDDLAARRRTAQDIEHYLRGLEATEALAWERAKTLAADLDRETVRERRQRKLAKFMQGWRAVHLPLAALLLVALMFHLFDVFNVGQAFAGEAEKRFAGAEDCVTCHETIVDEWKLSMHRNAQTSSTTRAQTPITLKQQPDFGRACVNCHAPLGVKFTQRAVFPLFEPDPVGDPQGVTEEGVNCVICHTQEKAPREEEGIKDTFKIGERGQLNFGTMFGPPLTNPDAIPNSVHDVATGFMDNDVNSSQMCSACHNVLVDIKGKPLPKDEAATEPLDNSGDDDGDGILNENEPDQAGDLILQTTYNEWEDYVAQEGKSAQTCVECHMPATTGPIVDSGPPMLGNVERDRQTHSFVGVDYDMNAAYYAAPGMPEDAMKTVLEEREVLLRNTVELSVKTGQADAGGLVTATVKLDNITGHNFPSGFAFARQWWIEISAKDASGDDVCLADAATPEGSVKSPCSSGVIKSTTEELKTCDTTNSVLDNSDAAAPPTNLDGDVQLNKRSIAPLGECDPWLVNLQKILTDADPDGDGVATEVAFQSLEPNIVRNRARFVPFEDGTQQVLAAIPATESDSYAYVFDASKAQGDIDVTATLRLRHLPPYFVQELDRLGSYAGELTAGKLLENMTIVDVASNKKLPEVLTTPSPEEFTNDKLVSLGKVQAPPAALGMGGSDGDGSEGGAELLLLGLLIPLAFGVRGARRFEP